MPVSTNTVDAVSVLDNTNAEAQWALAGATFLPTDGTAQVKSLNAGSGWTGFAYNDSQ